MDGYIRSGSPTRIPRLPLEGSIDLTYRCNNSCRHCWLRIPPKSPEEQRELGADEIRKLVDEARMLGCRKWSISGGEPMLRPDFPEIFDYITGKSASYSLNTNGSLITPEIARLMRRKGRKMVALYGATAGVHDHITGNPGSFQETMRGFQLLQEAGAEFIVQLIPMRDNYHQFPEMVSLAKSLSPHWRVGAAWLFLSASGDPGRNEEILRQRLSPGEVVELDKPDLSYGESTDAKGAADERADGERGDAPYCIKNDGGLFASCIAHRQSFHIDPYGQMSFCCFIKDPELRYDLRAGSLQDAWDVFIPSLADRIQITDEYRDSCGSCDLRSGCRWCPVYGYLEHGRFSARVDYLCQVARESRRFKKDYEKNHRIYYSCAGITVRFESDEPMVEGALHPTFGPFRTEGHDGDMISIRLYPELPYLSGRDLGDLVYQRGGWKVRRKDGFWIYTKCPNGGGEISSIATFSRDHTRVRIYGNVLEQAGSDDCSLQHDDLIFLTQTSLAHVLARRNGCFLHSSGVILSGKGILFLGRSGAGKSTLRRMILSMPGASSLCDDRNVVRKWPDGYSVHGTWANKSLKDVSAASLPLGAMMFVEQADENRIIPMEDRKEIIRRLLPRVIRPVESAEWWKGSLALVDDLAKDVPCYRVRCDLSGRIAGMVGDMSANLQGA